jgi:hypothetical protein
MKKLSIIVMSMLMANAVIAAENPAKQIKKQMCFETYPRTTYDTNGSHDWTINEVIENPGVYKTYKFITANKTKTGENVIFDFNGISRQYGKVINASGSGFYDSEEGWTLNVNSSTKLGEKYSVENQPYATSLATWDMYSSITSPGVGGGFMKFEAVSGQMPSEFYEVSVVSVIDCKDFNRNAPVAQ